MIDHGLEMGREYLVGKWIGEARLEGGGRRVWLNQRFNDGTYVITFRAYSKDGRFDEQTEHGNWGLSGDIYFTMMRGYVRDGRRIVDDGPRSSYRDDAYRVTKLTPTEFHYTSVATGRSYSMRKVADDFSLEMPNIR